MMTEPPTTEATEPAVETQRVISGHVNFTAIKSGVEGAGRVNTHYQVAKPPWEIQHVIYGLSLGTNNETEDLYYLATTDANYRPIEERYRSETDPVNAPAMEATVCSYDNLQSACGYASPCETS